LRHHVDILVWITALKDILSLIIVGIMDMNTKGMIMNKNGWKCQKSGLWTKDNYQIKRRGKRWIVYKSGVNKSIATAGILQLAMEKVRVLG
jgi:hypothetical protein